MGYFVALVFAVFFASIPFFPIFGVKGEWAMATLPLNQPSVPFQPLRPRQRHGVGAEFGDDTRIELQDRRALHEVEHAQSRRELGAAGGGEDVVGAADVIADHFRCVAPRMIAPALRIFSAMASGWRS
jgi:hypothetical protein